VLYNYLLLSHIIRHLAPVIYLATSDGVTIFVPMDAYFLCEMLLNILCMHWSLLSNEFTAVV